MNRIRLMHGICHYFGQWPPGDERGFRSVDHKIHSSGDYKNPPPQHEHEGLRNWIKSHMNGGPIHLQPHEYPVLGSAFILKIHKMKSTVRCLCCGATHIHLLYDSIAADAKEELGRAKQFASLKLESHPGRVFAKDCSVDEVANLQHARRTWTYILDHAGKEGAWVWRYDKHSVPTREDIKRLQALCNQFLNRHQTQKPRLTER